MILFLLSIQSFVFINAFSVLGMPNVDYSMQTDDIANQSDELISQSRNKVINTLVTHTPIVITSNSDFSAIATSGDGSQSIPWIIENYQIDASSADGISISNTNDYFIIQNILVNATSPAHSKQCFIW